MPPRKPTREKKRGAHSKLTEATKTALFALLSNGVPKEVACPGAGIQSRTLRTWLTKARAGDKRFTGFAEGYELAIAQGRIRLLAAVASHSKRDFRAPAWILEHAHGEVFGSKSQVKISLEQDRNKLLTIAENVLSPAQFDKLLAALTAEDVAGAGTGEAGAEESEE